MSDLSAYYKNPGYHKAFITAAEAGDAATARRLIAEGFDLRRELDQWARPVIYAVASAGHVEVIRALLDAGVDVNTRFQVETNYDQTTQITHVITPISVASSEGRTTAVEFLLSRGADPNIGSVTSGNALTSALSGGHSDCALALLRGGADPNSRQALGDRSALDATVELGLTDVFDALLAAGVAKEQAQHAFEIAGRLGDRRVAFGERLRTYLGLPPAGTRLSKDERKRMRRGL